jgi:penicillin-binding protein 1A
MLGLDYGRLQLVLPNWRYEGATQPFAVQMFPGWSSYVAYPFWIVGLFACVLLLFLTGHFWSAARLQESYLPVAPPAAGAVVALAWLVLSAGLYRSSLFDTHEGPTLQGAKGLARLLGLEIVSSFEYVIYRAKLAAHEQERVGVDLKLLAEMSEFIEDRRFRAHSGVSFRAIARALRNYGLRRKWAGGSTITQQLVRSLFIVDYRKVMRRKIVEMALAVWCERFFSKDEIMRLYLGAVRFETGVYGAAAAHTWFFRRAPGAMSRAEAFFLVERISNIRSRVLVARIDDLMRQAVEKGVLTPADVVALINLYARMVDESRLTPKDAEAFARLREKWVSGLVRAHGEATQ